MKLIKGDSIITKKWSGGTTKELLIYPSTSDYSKREFTYRISTATVDQDTSTFTLLPNINRYLMVLEGKLCIDHESQHHLEMQPFDIDIFDGGTKSTAKGKVTDFNLMTSSVCDGVLNYTSKFSEKVYQTNKNEHMILYVYKGQVKTNEVFKSGDLIVLEENEELRLKNASEDTVIIETKVIF